MLDLVYGTNLLLRVSPDVFRVVGSGHWALRDLTGGLCPFSHEQNLCYQATEHAAGAHLAFLASAQSCAVDA